MQQGAKCTSQGEAAALASSTVSSKSFSITLPHPVHMHRSLSFSMRLKKTTKKQQSIVSVGCTRQTEPVPCSACSTVGSEEQAAAPRCSAEGEGGGGESGQAPPTVQGFLREARQQPTACRHVRA